MELKVWVEGIQRVVCGISEQTSVQEVVIALAQATGRTGRYTLVEKWRDMEKLLPPSEHPMKVLAKWGEYAGEVQFLLKRTGASTVSSDTENMRGPERNVYRQSLPPPAKNRQKSELLQGLKRKEPKRKSLTITGGTPAYFGTESQDIRNQSNNNNKGLEFSTAQEDVKPSMLKSSVVVSNSDAGKANGKMTGTSKSAEKDRTSNTASPKDGKRKNKDSKSKTKKEQDKKDKQEQKNSKQPLLPPHMKKRDGKASVPSATAVLFPSESKSEVAAKSPVKKNQENIFNKSNGNTKKVPLMPPSNKILRSRTEGNSVDQGQLVSASTSFIPSHTRNNSSGSVPFNPLSVTNSNKLDVSSTQYGNSLPRSGKKPWSEWRSMDDWKTADSSENNLGKQKSPLMPPHSHRKHSSPRLKSPPPTPTNFHSRGHSTDRSQTPLSSVTRNTEYNRAVDEFSRLSLEQQKHIEEQQETVKALDEEVKTILQKMHNIESEVQDEVDQLKERNKLLVPLEDDAKLTQELYAEEKRNANIQREMDQLQSEIDHTKAKLTDYNRITENLTKEIANERYRLQLKQQKEEQEENRRLIVKVKQDMDRATREVDSMEDEFRRTENECFMKNEDIEAKYAELESLNRELRQVKLQQFIRQTGSKVTVLPPNAEDLNNHIQSRPATFANQKGSRPPAPSAVGQRGGSEGVWV